MNHWSPVAPVNGQPTYLATSCRASQVSDDRRDHLLVWPIYQPFSKLEPSRSFTSPSSSTDSSVRSRLAGLGSLQPKHARYALAPQMRMTLPAGTRPDAALLGGQGRGRPIVLQQVRVLLWDRGRERAVADRWGRGDGPGGRGARDSRRLLKYALVIRVRVRPGDSNLHS